MQSYQSVGLLIGIVTLVLGLIGSAVVGNLGIWVAIVSFIGMILVLLNPKHHRGVGIVLIVLGIIGNLLLIIPGAMALRYKPESESEIKPKSKEEGARVKGIADGEREKDEEERREEQRLKDEIKRLEDKKKQLEKEKGD
jgi:membrane-bound ClpP family serine protease